jgi:nicotinate (nicotinamide) nucleotide adenylyltransferase
MELEKVIGDYLRARGWTLSIAESCTGGLISDRITNVPGSSDYYTGGMVTYSMEAKAKHLDIPLDIIEKYGVVSSPVAKRMAQGVRKAFQTTFGLSITGVAGPTGGTPKTPIGRVFIGISNERKTWVRREDLKGGRREIKKEAAEKSLKFFYETLIHSRPSRIVTTLPQKLETLRMSKKPTIVLIRKASRGVTHQKGRLGILPASFNPPTKAHLALIKEAKGKYGFDEILVVLDIRAMDKRLVGANIEDRVIMLKMLFQEDPEVSIGLSNQGLFVEKLKPLRDLYPSPIEFTFIVGFDTILRVMDKRYYYNRKRSLDELFGQSRFLVANRGDQEREAFEKLFNKRRNERYRERISFFGLPEEFSSISSSFVRKKIAEGQPVDDFIPKKILRFIEKAGLYTEKYLDWEEIITPTEGKVGFDSQRGEGVGEM